MVNQLKIYINGDSHSNGDGIGDLETFPNSYPGHCYSIKKLNTSWCEKRSSMIRKDLSLWKLSNANNRKGVWGTILGQLINATVANNSVGGSCMLGIATRTIADLELIRSRADLPNYVFIGLTNPDRLAWYNEHDIANPDKTFNWVQSVIPSFQLNNINEKYKKLFKTTWTTLSDEEFLIDFLKECLLIKNYVNRRIGRDPIFLNTTYIFPRYQDIVANSKNKWLHMLWFDLLEFDKINPNFFNKGKVDTYTACGHLLPNAHSDYARDLAREHFGWGNISTQEKISIDNHHT
jgi:hypothetical protein